MLFREYIGKPVIVRTYSAGVHFGTLVARDGREVVLNTARRIWQWEGAFTLSAIAENGIKKGRLSIAVPNILLTEAIEVIPCAENAAAGLAAMRAYTP